MKIDQKTCTSPHVLQLLEAFGTALKSARIKHRFTHEEVAAACNFSRQTLSRIERGDPSVAIGQIARYAEHVGATKALVLKPVLPEVTVRNRVRRTAQETQSLRAAGGSAPTSTLHSKLLNNPRGLKNNRGITFFKHSNKSLNVTNMVP